MEEKFYSIQEIAQILKVTYLTVYRWIRAGNLKAFQVQKQYRIKESDLNKFVEQGRKK